MSVRLLLPAIFGKSDTPPNPEIPIGSIGIAGQQGFGVGVCPEPDVLVELGMSEMEGTTDPSHPNYGNYIHTNGGISVFIPKFFYRIGDPDSPRYSKYGLNAHDIVGVDVFANEAEANLAGFALHRAFVDDGQEKCGFFHDKYLASKDGSTSCKSVKMGHPISLTTTAGLEPSSTMLGCSGALTDAVVLSRARGYGWNAVLLFMADVLAKISMAHGQAATSSNACAWYDPAGVTNFPKGCNSGSLSDINDPSVTFSAASGSKPLTGSASDFAKTTHNGQANGITDVNGGIYQITIGVTQAGTAANSATQLTNGQAFVLKRTAKHADLTEGWNGSTDAWGNTTGLDNNFDAISGFLPWGSTTGGINFGNGNNQVFSGALSGVDYLRSCCSIQATTASMSAAGTPLFGNDACFRWARHNMVPYVAGTGASASNAGVFMRYWNAYRSAVNQDSFGFRAAAYGSK